MPAKKFSVEQIVAKLREAERLQGQGLTIPQLCTPVGPKPPSGRRLGPDVPRPWNAEVERGVPPAATGARPACG
ncbi:MAG: hypothetical protein ACRDHO_01460 [Actinomycetota bacterium]